MADSDPESVGAEIARRLEEFVGVLESGAPICEKFSVRRISLVPESGFGVVLQTSPPPLQAVGYYYEVWPHGRRRELYRVPVGREEYDAAVERARADPGLADDKARDYALFMMFLPKEESEPDA